MSNDALKTTVTDLINLLELVKDEGFGDARVFLSRDSEGNGFEQFTDGREYSGTSMQKLNGEDVLVLWPGGEYADYFDDDDEDDEDD